MTSPGDEARAFEMYLAGASPEAIAAAAGFASPAAAIAAVQDQLGRLGLPTGGDAASVELARYDALLVGLWPRARRGDLAAVDMVLRISDRRLKVLAAMPDRPAESAGEVRTPLDELNERRAARGAGSSRQGCAKVADKPG